MNKDNNENLRNIDKQHEMATDEHDTHQMIDENDFESTVFDDKTLAPVEPTANYTVKSSTASAKTQTETKTEKTIQQPEEPPKQSPNTVRSSPTSASKAQSNTVASNSAKLAGAQKIGIIGGKGAGKSYLFQSIVYRTCGKYNKCGAISYFIAPGGVNLYKSPLKLRENPMRIQIGDFVEDFQSWKILSTTLVDNQTWFRYQIPYRTGWLGNKQNQLEIEFFDASGEMLSQKTLKSEEKEILKVAYLDATTMVFCLPMWSIIPDSQLSNENSDLVKVNIQSFRQVISNYRSLRDEFNIKHKVNCILALTMADDERNAPNVILDRWIKPYLNDPVYYLKNLNRASGITRYLANARKISAYMHDIFQYHNNPLVSSIPDLLDFHGKPTWILPISAIDGKMLENIKTDCFPTPAHVELPLLVTLCEKTNALM